MLLFRITCSYFTDEIFSLVSFDSFALQLFSSSCFHLFLCLFIYLFIFWGTCLSYYRSSSKITSYLATPSYLRVGHRKAIGSPERTNFVYFELHYKVFLLCHFIREIPKSICLSFVSYSDWISQRRLCQFLS